MRNDFQRKDEINQLIKKYKETQNELINLKNKKQNKIGIISLFVLLFIMYVGFYFLGQALIPDTSKMCGEPTEALGNTM